MNEAEEAAQAAKQVSALERIYDLCDRAKARSAAVAELLADIQEIAAEALADVTTYTVCHVPEEANV